MMARQVRPWLGKFVVVQAHQVRDNDGAPISVFHQGQRQ